MTGQRGAQVGMGGQCHIPAALPWGKHPVLIVQEAGWTPGSVWMGAENLARIGIRSPNRPKSGNTDHALSVHNLSYFIKYNSILGYSPIYVWICKWSFAFKVSRQKLHLSSHPYAPHAPPPHITCLFL